MPSHDDNWLWDERALGIVLAYGLGVFCGVGIGVFWLEILDFVIRL